MALNNVKSVGESTVYYNEGNVQEYDMQLRNMRSPKYRNSK